MKLPVKQILKRNKYKIVDKEGFEIISDVERLCDVMIIEDSLNNYPKAIELLNRFLKFNESNYKDLNVEFDINYDTKQFLKSIE